MFSLEIGTLLCFESAVKVVGIAAVYPPAMQQNAEPQHTFVEKILYRTSDPPSWPHAITTITFAALLGVGWNEPKAQEKAWKSACARISRISQPHVLDFLTFFK